ncbi:MAG: VOC family protein [Actinomycetota bacterium]
MTARLTHFAINADDVDAARRFYESVFGWRFRAWGPPGFYQIETGADSGAADQGAVQGALQGRRHLLDAGPTLGFECTFAVDDLTATAAAVAAAGGQVRMDRFTIEEVGDLMAFEDVAGNVFLAMEYLEGAAP